LVCCNFYINHYLLLGLISLLTCKIIINCSITENQHLPPGVNQLDIELYQEVLQKAVVKVSNNLTEVPLEKSHSQIHTGQSPKSIEIGKWNIETWYSSPFPQEYAR